MKDKILQNRNRENEERDDIWHRLSPLPSGIYHRERGKECQSNYNIHHRDRTQSCNLGTLIPSFNTQCVAVRKSELEI